MAKVYQGQPSLQYWEATQKVLQGDIPLVRRPRLTEALLKKPPFRFLHDIITELVNAMIICMDAGVPPNWICWGLFNQEEQISSNIKDKESKVAYLWKIVNCVGITLNAYVPARPLKIVSGMEPEQTNIFLQMLAAATTVDSPIRQRAVSRVLFGVKMPSPEQGTMEWAHLYFLLSGCVLPGMKEGGVATHRSAEETVAASLLGITSQHSTPANEYLVPKTTGREEMDRNNFQKLHVGNSASVPSAQQSLPSTRGNSPAAARPMTVGGDGRANFNAWTARLDKLGGSPPFAARPQSARKGPPKIHNSVVTAEKALPKNSAASPPEIVSSLMGEGASGKEMCSRRLPSIFHDSEAQEDDECDALPVLIPAQQHLPETLVSTVGSGKLSESIAASSEDVENVVERAGDDSVEEQDMILGAIEETKEDAQTRQEEVQKLRVMVQSLCQATNPLGKSIDCLQEDEEAMNKEHQFWIKERDIYSARLDEEKRITDEMLQAETGRILELEEQAHHYQHKITSAKAQILRNSDTIMTLLRMVTSPQLE